MNEIWKPVRGFETFYECSDKGRVRNRQKQYLVGSVTPRGARRVGLSRPRRPIRYRFVHRLVAESFLRPCIRGHFVAHRNGVKLDNAAENLVFVRRGCTRTSFGLGEKCPNSKLTTDQVIELRALRHRGWTLQALSRRYGVAVSTVHRAATGVTWRHIPDGLSCSRRVGTDAISEF